MTRQHHTMLKNTSFLLHWCETVLPGYECRYASPRWCLSLTGGHWFFQGLLPRLVSSFQLSVVALGDKVQAQGDVPRVTLFITTEAEADGAAEVSKALAGTVSVWDSIGCGSLGAPLVDNLLRLATASGALDSA
jgi:hypothetical protein